MLHARLLFVALVGIAACSCVSGCKPGPLPKDPFMAKIDRISLDGSQSLADVETIMGAKGMEVPKEVWEVWKKGGNGIDPAAPPFAKSKLVKDGDNKFKAVADESGTEAKVFRWEAETNSKNARASLLVAVLEDRVVFAVGLFSSNSGN